ncbi:MAG TPA: hypothetical protein DCE14_08705 [Kosmotogaceae bacterium]|nr:hypothetical protein [Kosmotogaceae bacterium]
MKTLKWQFGLTWQLANYHLPELTDHMCLWEPVAECWSVRKKVDGKWFPDWSDKEPDPPPVVTIGWLTWHLNWWWSSLLARVNEEEPVPRNEVAWPGSAESVVARLNELSEKWTGFLDGLSSNDLEKPFDYPWPEPRPLKIALAWANSELMKNIAEIGIIHHLYKATHNRG